MSWCSVCGWESCETGCLSMVRPHRWHGSLPGWFGRRGWPSRPRWPVNVLAVWTASLFQSCVATVVLLNACCNVCLPGRNTLVPRSGATSCNISVVGAIQCNGHCYSLQAYQHCFSRFFAAFQVFHFCFRLLALHFCPATQVGVWPVRPVFWERTGLFGQQFRRRCFHFAVPFFNNDFGASCRDS